jgi:hypothetical protein
LDDPLKTKQIIIFGTGEMVAIGRQCVLGAGVLVLEDQSGFSVVAPRGSKRSAAPSHRLRKL